MRLTNQTTNQPTNKSQPKYFTKPLLWLQKVGRSLLELCSKAKGINRVKYRVNSNQDNDTRLIMCKIMKYFLSYFRTAL